mmetsp:Transcript_34064/g.83510  ORF Transcript_34064/g.83510 Transcript_34064/m.83510 type:complete len:359 (+) Transcript_34064:1-1077(+)
MKRAAEAEATSATTTAAARSDAGAAAGDVPKWNLGQHAPTHATLHTGAKMPTIGLGTWLSAAGAVEAAVYEALRVGYRHVDCAAIYGNEAEVGAGLRRAFADGVCARADVFVTSKLWNTCHAPDAVAPALERTLGALGLDYVDLYLVHWPFAMARDAPLPPPPEQVLGYDAARELATWRALEPLVAAGKARALGVSNYTVAKLRALLANELVVRPAVNQVESHPHLLQTRLHAYCAAERIVLQAYSPLGNPGRPARLKSDDEPALLEHATVTAIAAAHDKQPAQVLLRWQVQRGWVALAKSTTPARIAANARVYDFVLADDDMARLDALCGGVNRRLLRGAVFCTAGQHWTDLWDGEH